MTSKDLQELLKTQTALRNLIQRNRDVPVEVLAARNKEDQKGPTALQLPFILIQVCLSARLLHCCQALCSTSASRLVRTCRLSSLCSSNQVFVSLHWVSSATLNCRTAVLLVWCQATALCSILPGSLILSCLTSLRLSVPKRPQHLEVCLSQ